MIKIFNLDDEQFYNMLSSESLKRFEPIKEATKYEGIIPLVEITGSGMINSWYNKHVGKKYKLYKYIVNMNNGYINYLVESRDDGTKLGYKPMYSMHQFGKGIDLVHGCACEMTIGFIKQN